MSERKNWTDEEIKELTKKLFSPNDIRDFWVEYIHWSYKMQSIKDKHFSWSSTDIQREQLEDPDPPEEKTWRDRPPLL